MKDFLVRIGNTNSQHLTAAWKNAHLWYIVLIMAACSTFYYLDSIFNSLDWDILYVPHDIHRLLFGIPVLYASLIFKTRGAIIITLISALIFLPYALFISPYPNPVIRPLLFCGVAGTIGILVAKLLNEVTEHKKSEEKLRESVERYRFLMDNSLDAVWFSVFEEPIDITLPEAEIARLMGEREVIVEANDVLAKMQGFDRGSQLIGKHWSELDPDEYTLHVNMEIVRNQYKIDRRVYTDKDSEGNVDYFEESEVANIVDGKLVSSFGIARDITQSKKIEEEKKELEQKAQLASRLATVGEMASGVAHEINNPLTGVIGFSQLLAQSYRLLPVAGTEGGYA